MKFFEITLQTLNLFSFMMGMFTASMLSYGWYGRRNVWFAIILYISGLALYYYLRSNGQL